MLPLFVRKPHLNTLRQPESSMAQKSIVCILQEFNQKSSVVLMLNLLREVVQPPIIRGAIGDFVQKCADLTARLINYYLTFHW